MAKKRTSHSPQFKAKVALEAARDRQTISELGRKFSVHSSLIRQWKKQLLEHVPEVFENPGSRRGVVAWLARSAIPAWALAVTPQSSLIPACPVPSSG